MKHSFFVFLLIFSMMAQTASAMVSNDPFREGLWWLRADSPYGTRAKYVWQYTLGSPEVIVAVIDTGIDYLHDELAANIWTNSKEIKEDGIDNDNNGLIDDYYGFDFVDMDADPTDRELVHGTPVAGAIAGIINNGIGGMGVAPHVRVMALRVLGNMPAYRINSTFEQAIDYAVANGARVVNMSLTHKIFNRVLYRTIAKYPDVLFVVAAGNDNHNIDSAVTSPANFTKENIIGGEVFPALSNVLTVGATEFNGVLASYSNYGPLSVCIAAPAGIFSSRRRIEIEGRMVSSFGLFDGTSMATGLVSGGVALLLSKQNNLSPEQVIKLLKENVTRVPSLSGKIASGGIINLQAAIRAIPPKLVSVSPKNNSVENSLFSNIEIEFSTPVIKGDSFKRIRIVSDAGEDIPYRYILNSNTLTLIPTSHFAGNTIYSVQVPRGALTGLTKNQTDEITLTFKTQNISNELLGVARITPLSNADSAQIIESPSLGLSGPTVSVMTYNPANIYLYHNPLNTGLHLFGYSKNLKRWIYLGENNARIENPNYFLGFTLMNISDALQFRDIAHHFARRDVFALTVMNIMRGYPDGTFRANNNITGREFMALLTRLNIEADESLNIGRTITRGDIAKALAESLTQTDIDTTKAGEIMREKGLMRGFPDGTLRLNNPITRGEVATVLHRLIFYKIKPAQ